MRAEHGKAVELYGKVFFTVRLFLTFSRLDTLARSEHSQVRDTSFSGEEGTRLLPAISCIFCNPHGSCIEQSGIEAVSLGRLGLCPKLSILGLVPEAGCL